MQRNILLKAALLFTLVGFSYNSKAQVQIGLDIDGEATADNSGTSVSMPDANTVAIGALYNNGNGTQAGHVRIYSWNGSVWVQKGMDIDGEAAYDNSGLSVSMPDANTVAIGAPLWNDIDGDGPGYVQIYAWTGSAWIQKGLDIEGEAVDDWLGWSVCMPDSNTVAIGAPHNIVSGAADGYVRIYEWNGSAWGQKGSDIYGESGGDMSGNSVSMPDANTLAISAQSNDGNGPASGHVRIYTWNGTTWVQKGLDIDGEAAYDYSATSVSMPDSNTVAIGDSQSDVNGEEYAGRVRIYGWNGSAWVQKGMDIEGELEWNFLGYSISMPDSNIVAIGIPDYDAGHVRLYSWNASSWVQKGPDIIGESYGDGAGSSISMPDSNTVAIGAPYNDGNGIGAGHVRIYSGFYTGMPQNDFANTLVSYPNPTDGSLTLDLGSIYSTIIVIVRNELGQEVNKQLIDNTSKPQVTLKGEAGIYFIEVNADSKSFVLKAMKE